MLVVVSSYTNRWEAALARARLESSGIRARLRNEQVHGMFPVDAMEIQLCVLAEDVDAAKEILRSEVSEPLAVEEDFRDIGKREILFIRRRHRWKRFRWLLWAVILLLVLLLFLFGW